MLSADDEEFDVNPFRRQVPQLEFYVAPKLSKLSKMGLSSQKLVKWMLFAFNLIFLLLGLGLIAAGAVARLAYGKYLSFLDSGYTSAPIFMIIVGVIVAVVSFFGCCGSLKDNYCMLISFAVMLGVLFIFEISGAIAAYVERGQIEGYLHQNMEQTLADYSETPSQNNVWDTTQKDLSCCGVDSYKDWINATKIPQSCCKSENVTNNPCDTSADKIKTCDDEPTSATCPINTVGCLTAIRSTVEDNIAEVGGVGIAIAFIQLVGMLLACFIAKRIHSGYTYA
jgi:CD63 antigen